MGDLKKIHCGDCGKFLFATELEEGDAGCPKCKVYTAIKDARRSQPKERTRARRKSGDKVCEVCGSAGARTRNLRGKEVDTCGRGCSLRWSLARRK